MSTLAHEHTKEALGRRPNTPQVFLTRGCWSGQSDQRKLLPGQTDPWHKKRGVWAGDRRRAKRAGMPKKVKS